MLKNHNDVCLWVDQTLVCSYMRGGLSASGVEECAFFFVSFSTAFYSSDPAAHGDCLLQGYGCKQVVAAMFTHWQKKYFMLYPNRIEVGDSLLVCTCICMSMCLRI